MAYINTVELATGARRFPPNAKPSLLQTKLKRGQNRLQDLVAPLLEPGNQVGSEEGGKEGAWQGVAWHGQTGAYQREQFGVQRALVFKARSACHVL